MHPHEKHVGSQGQVDGRGQKKRGAELRKVRTMTVPRYPATRRAVVSVTESKRGPQPRVRAVQLGSFPGSSW